MTTHYAVAARIEAHQRELEAGISQITHENNQEIKSKIEMSNKIHADRDERQFKYSYTKSIDCTQMIKDFNIECLTLNYQLKRLVADKDSHH